ncbi:MAG: hypothetical protein ACOCSN_03630 [Halanaeroarchaeum sp.]
MATVPFPLEGTVLIVGPSQVGKTTMTAAALEGWIAAHGPAGVVVLDFAPEYETEGRILGGRITRFTTVPDEAWHGVLAAHAPRAQSEGDAEAAVRLAAANAARAVELFHGAPPSPRAVFVNDATIPFQHERGHRTTLLEYCDRAEFVVLNAFESDELGVDDPVSRQERRALETFRRWADRVVELPREDDRPNG